MMMVIELQYNKPDDSYGSILCEDLVTMLYYKETLSADGCFNFQVVSRDVLKVRLSAYLKLKDELRCRTKK